jgi:GAF domain-containing protein
MDPLHETPETREAIDELEPSVDDELLEQLLDRGRRVRIVVPDCVGMSVASSRHDVIFTLVASEPDIATLDAMQYLHDGPCVTAVQGERVLEFGHEQFVDEHQWHLFAQATAAMGVRSTLTLPILVAGRVTGSVNLYAASRYAFDGRHEEVAAIFSAWAPGAVSNADLAFETRRLAAEAPAKLRAAAKVSTAVGIIAGALDIDEDAARRALSSAAVCAGVSELRLAQTLIDIRQEDDR